MSGDGRDRQQTLASFDWQWAHLPDGDFMPGDPWFDANATRVLSDELCAISPSWFAGRSVLDAGCGQGRWTRALLELGATVTAVDFSEAGLARTREVCGNVPRLHTQQVDLLDPPADLNTAFDLVFSFGVLHHTGDTWRALEDVARRVSDDGALVLYLYGSKSWSPSQGEHVERLRRELEPLAFEEKIAELRRRFPGDDTHQMFDLLSPVINDRVTFEDVRDRLKAMGFERIDQTIVHTEVYVRATRPGFRASALLSCVANHSSFVAENALRDGVRRGAAFEDALRGALASVEARVPSRPAIELLRALPRADVLLEVSLPPERLPAEVVDSGLVQSWCGPSLITPGLPIHVRANGVIFLGASLGACRYPEVMLHSMWNRLVPGGWLAVEISPGGFPGTRRSVLDKVRSRRSTVPEKLSMLLRRRQQWSSGEGLFALGGSTLLNPLSVERARALLGEAGATAITVTPIRAGSVLVTALLPP